MRLFFSTLQCVRATGRVSLPTADEAKRNEPCGKTKEEQKGQAKGEPKRWGRGTLLTVMKKCQGVPGIYASLAAHRSPLHPFLWKNAQKRKLEDGDGKRRETVIKKRRKKRADLGTLTQKREEEAVVDFVIK
jgi:hypothetical protein